MPTAAAPTYHSAVSHVDYFALEQANVLGCVDFGDQVEKVEIGADLTTTQTQCLFACHFNLG